MDVKHIGVIRQTEFDNTVPGTRRVCIVCIDFSNSDSSINAVAVDMRRVDWDCVQPIARHQTVVAKEERLIVVLIQHCDGDIDTGGERLVSVVPGHKSEAVNGCLLPVEASPNPDSTSPLLHPEQAGLCVALGQLVGDPAVLIEVAVLGVHHSQLGSIVVTFKHCQFIVGLVKDRPVVVGVVDPEDDLGDGGQPSLVLGRDVQDVGCQRLDLCEEILILGVHNFLYHITRKILMVDFDYLCAHV